MKSASSERALITSMWAYCSPSFVCASCANCSSGDDTARRNVIESSISTLCSNGFSKPSTM